MSDHQTAKWLSKQMKARGLQKLRFYCQVCQKQCRDANGFQSHTRSPSHLRNISSVSERDIDEYSSQFEESFLELLRVNHGEKRVQVNKVYNEFIQDRDHVHMNATRFTSLARFVKHLGSTGKVRVYGPDTENESESPDTVDMTQLQISYVDTSRATARRKQMVEELEQNERSDQQIKALLLQRQMQIQKQQQTQEPHAAVTEAEPQPQTLVDAGNVQIKLATAKKPAKVSKRRTHRHKNVFQ